MDREVCHFSYLRAKQWTVKCAISRIYVLNNGDTRNGTLGGQLLSRLTRKITNAYSMNAFFSWFIYQNVINS
jgi:hypothetical protein